MVCTHLLIGTNFIRYLRCTIYIEQNTVISGDIRSGRYVVSSFTSLASWWPHKYDKYHNKARLGRC